jgi:2-polyprenyl-3-methyl-5-hydroxy-6-metoxy-1,4-benzoquinol methylase
MCVSVREEIIGSGVNMTEDLAVSKIGQVKSFFDVPDRYLSPRQFDIQIRIESVNYFTNTLRPERVLDIGCGDGSISVPLLQRCKQLTLLDLSDQMIERARGRVPVDRLNDVELIKGSFLGSNLKSESYDLIICLGVLAHVDSPAAVIAEIVRLAKPGASVILEFTDSYHWWGVPVVVYQQLLKLIRPQPYALNRLRRQQVIRLCEENNLKISGLYRYGLPPLGAQKVAAQEKLYRGVRYMFGPSDRNRNSWMGNQYIYLLQKV